MRTTLIALLLATTAAAPATAPATAPTDFELRVAYCAGVQEVAVRTFPECKGCGVITDVQSVMKNDLARLRKYLDVLRRRGVNETDLAFAEAAGERDQARLQAAEAKTPIDACRSSPDFPSLERCDERNLFAVDPETAGIKRKISRCAVATNDLPF